MLMTLVAKNQGHSAAVTCLAFSPQVTAVLELTRSS